MQYGCVRSYTVVSLAIDCASAKVLISHTLPQFPHRFVFITIAINPFSRFPTSPFHAPNCSKSRHFGTKSVVLLAIDSPLRKSCFSVRFVQTYSLDSLPPPSRRTQQIQPFHQSCAAVCRNKTGYPLYSPLSACSRTCRFHAKTRRFSPRIQLSPKSCRLLKSA